MKKKILGIAVMVVVALTVGWNINQSENDIKLSDLALDNVEALASGEGGGGGSDCYKCSYDWRVICDNVQSWCAGHRMYIFP